MPTRLNLLYPEWQSCQSRAVHAGALWLASELFAHDNCFGRLSNCLCIEAPIDEQLQRSNGVSGLSSIAPRFRLALQRLNEEQPAGVLLVGGTCAAEAPPLAYLNNLHHSDLAVVWFDAHGDLNTPQTSPSGQFHGMVLRTLLGEGPPEYLAGIPLPLVPRQVFLAGTRDLDPPESDFIRQRHISVTPAVDATSGKQLRDAIAGAGYRRIYVHIDVDVINPGSFSEALMPVSGGPSLDDLAACMWVLAEAFEVAGASLVEYCGQSQESRRLLARLLVEGGVTPALRGLIE